MGIYSDRTQTLKGGDPNEIASIIKSDNCNELLMSRDRSIVTSPKLFAKVLKTFDILQTEGDSNVFLFQQRVFLTGDVFPLH